MRCSRSVRCIFGFTESVLCAALVTCACACACSRDPAPAKPPPVPSAAVSVAAVSSADASVALAADAEAPDLEEDKEVPASAAFRLALVEKDASWGNPPAFHPCALRDGTTILCGLKRVVVARDDRVEISEAMEAGLPRDANAKELDGTIAGFVGHWPDDAWLVMSVKGPCRDCTFAAYRWEGDAWRETAQFEDESFARDIGAWRGSLVGLLRHGMDKYELRVLAGVKRPLPSAPELACTGLSIGPSALAASGRTIFVPGHRCRDGAWGVMRWTLGAPSSAYDEVDGAPSMSSRAWARGDRAALYGSSAATQRGALVSFDGTRWSKEDLPPRVANVFAHDRVGNVQWLLSEQEGETKKGQTRQLWTRTGSEPWRAQNAWKASVPAHYGLLTEVVGLTVAGGSAWLTVNVESRHGCVGIQGCPQRTLVLRTGAVAKAQDLPL